MCRLKSCIVLKDRVFCPDYDSHADMLRELGIKDTAKNAETKFVRVELSPKGGNKFSPVETWKFRVDQDIRPDWFFGELERPKVVEAVKAWAADHIFEDRDDFELASGSTYYLKNCRGVAVRGGSQVTAYENCLITALENSRVIAWKNSQVTAWDNSQVTAWDNSQVTALDNSQVVALDNSRVIAWDNSWVIARGNSVIVLESKCCLAPIKNIFLRENSTLKVCETKTIYQCGGWKLVPVKRDEQEDE